MIDILIVAGLVLLVIIVLVAWAFYIDWICRRELGRAIEKRLRWREWYDEPDEADWWKNH